jgi:hypothetical protein
MSNKKRKKDKAKKAKGKTPAEIGNVDFIFEGGHVIEKVNGKDVTVTDTVATKPVKPGKVGKTSHTGTYVSCYESHPVLKLGKGEILGASCIHPEKGFDIYVGLDSGMKRTFSPYPWEPAPTELPPIEILYYIADMTAPTKANTPTFKKMVTWMAEQLNEGKRIHIGCMGGHGRTGTVLAALVKEMTGNEDAGQWVRDNYCKKAIESKVQIEFLHEHYGIKKVEGSKEYSGFYGGGDWGGYYGGGYGAYYGKSGTGATQPKFSTFAPMDNSAKSVWAF